MSSLLLSGGAAILFVSLDLLPQVRPEEECLQELQGTSRPLMGGGMGGLQDPVSAMGRDHDPAGAVDQELVFVDGSPCVYSVPKGFLAGGF